MRRLSLILVLVAGALLGWTASALRPVPALAGVRLADTPAPSMSFTNAFNALGLLNSIVVVPNEISVSAGARVAFNNKTMTPLTLRVAGQQATFPAGATLTFAFPGATTAQSFTVSAAALNLPIVGTLTSSTGRITVASRAPAPGIPSPIPSSRAGSPASSSAALDSLARSPMAPKTEGLPSAWPNQTSPGTGGDVPPELVAKEMNGARATGRSAAMDRARAVPHNHHATGAARSASLVGLMILMGTVLLIGVCSAAIRAVLGFPGARHARH